MEAHHRRIIKALKHHAPGLTFESVRAKRHIVVDFIYRDQKLRYTMAASPAVEEHEYRNTCTAVCKAFDLPRMRF